MAASFGESEESDLAALCERAGASIISMMLFAVLILILGCCWAGAVLGRSETNERLRDLTGRIKELGEKSTQVLMFLTFAIAAVVLLGYGASDPKSQVAQKIVHSATLQLWVLAIFPVAIGVLPVKEFWSVWPFRKFCRDKLRWYRTVRWFKFWLLWVAIGYITLGTFCFFFALR